MLDNLGRDKDGLLGTFISTKGLADFFLDALPIFVEEPCMEERDNVSVLLFQLLIGLLCLVDGIAEYTDTPLVFGYGE